MGFPASMMFLHNRAKQCLFLLLIMAVIADNGNVALDTRTLTRTGDTTPIPIEAGWKVHREEDRARIYFRYGDQDTDARASTQTEANL